MLNIEEAEKWYEENLEKLDAHKNIVHSLLLGLLNRKTYFKIESRIKNKKSLLQKIIEKNKYNSIFDITDIIGLRIIVPLNSDVDNIVNIIRNEFKIDEKNTIDKRKKSNNEFGYKSFHIVCELDGKRENLPEYSVMKNLKVEIQVRTILQHAWSDYQHDIGYKGYEKISDNLERRIYRLSVLLEIADDEFEQLSKEKQRESQEITERIENKDYNIKISLESLTKFHNENENIKVINEKLCSEYNILIDGSPLIINSIVERLLFLEIDTIEDVNLLLEKHKEILPDFIFEFYRLYSLVGELITPKYTAPLFYLTYVILFEKEDSSLLTSFQNRFGIPDNFIRTLEKAYSNVSNN